MWTSQKIFFQNIKITNSGNDGLILWSQMQIQSSKYF